MTKFKTALDDNFFVRFFFINSIVLVFKLLFTQSSINNLYHLPKSFESNLLQKNYHMAKSKLPKTQQKHRFVLWKMFKIQIIIGAILAILAGVLVAYQSYLIKSIISSITQNNQSSLTYRILTQWMCVFIIRTLLLENSVRMFHEVGQKAQMISGMIVMEKIGDIPSHEKHAIIKSQVLSMYVLEIKMINAFFRTAHFIFLSPTAFILAIVLILSEGLLLGIIIVHGLAAIMYIMYMANEELKLKREKRMIIQRGRINTNIQLLSQIKQLKRLGWEKLLDLRYMSLQEDENTQNSQENMLIKLYQSVILLTPMLILTLVVFANFLQNQTLQSSLSISQIYTVVNFIYLIQSPLKSIRTVALSVSDFQKALNKIQSFLRIDSVLHMDCSDSKLQKGSVIIDSLMTLNRRGSFIQYNFSKQPNSKTYFQSMNKNNQKTQLQIRYRMIVKPGQRLIILSNNNEGSTLLASIAGNFKKTNGILAYNGKLGYVSNKLWFSDDSIKENILCGKQYNKKKLNSVIYIADLNEEIKLYDQRQNTPMTSQHYFSISQQSRIAYARALYTDPDILLLDETFKTMNRATIQTLTNRMKQKLQNKTILIATNSIYSPLQNDKILIFKDGKTVQYGIYSQLICNPKSQIIKFFNFDTSPYKSHQFLQQQKYILKKQRVQNFLFKLRRQLRKRTYFKNLLKIVKQKGVSYIHQFLDKRKKEVNVKVIMQKCQKKIQQKSGLQFYPRLTEYGSDSLTIFNYVLIFVNQAVNLLIIWWLGYLSKQQTEQEQRKFIITFTTIVVFYILISLLQNKIQILIAKQASSKIGKTMIKSISKADPSYFSNTPLSVTTDKLNQDHEVTYEVFSKASSSVRNISIFFVTLILIGIQYIDFTVHATWLFAFCMCLLYVVFQAQKRISSFHTTFSYNLNASIQDMYDGIETNRYYGDPRQFTESCKQSVYEYSVYRHNQRQSFHINNICTQLFSIFLVWYLVFYIIRNRNNLNEAGILHLGVSINYALRIAGVLSNLNQDVISAEIAITKNLKKMFLYIDLPEEKNYETPNKPEGWPKQVTVQFNNVSLKRAEQNIAPIIHQMNFKIDHVQRVSFFGRGTSGIYSIFPAITRMIKPTKNIDGTIGDIKIGGININNIGRRFLMEQVFHLVPTPFVFSSTLLENIDPFDEFPSSEIIRLLKKLGVNDIIKCPQNDLLSYPIMMEQTSLALKQIINIVRSILRTPSLILCESIEPSTTHALTELIISEQLPHSTILLSNPHLHYVTYSDRIIFLSNGRIIEDGSPLQIFQQNQSTFVKGLSVSQPMNYLELKNQFSTNSSKRNSSSRLPPPE